MSVKIIGSVRTGPDMCGERTRSVIMTAVEDSGDDEP